MWRLCLARKVCAWLRPSRTFCINVALSHQFNFSQDQQNPQQIVSGLSGLVCNTLEVVRFTHNWSPKSCRSQLPSGIPKSVTWYKYFLIIIHLTFPFWVHLLHCASPNLYKYIIMAHLNKMCADLHYSACKWSNNDLRSFGLTPFC